MPWVLRLNCGLLLCCSVLLGSAWISALPRSAVARGAARACKDDTLSDASFLISTSCSSARRECALAKLARIPLEPHVRIFERDENGARGCFTSHLCIYKEAVEKGLPWALIFEDNLEISQDISEAMRVAHDWVQGSEAQREGEGAGSVLHLSLVHAAASLRLTVEPAVAERHAAAAAADIKVVKVQRTAPDWYGPVQILKAPGLGTTAYLIRREAMELILAKPHFKEPIDDLLAERFPGSTYALFPTPLFRGQEPSLVNPDQQLFRNVMYNEDVFRKIEKALVWTGFSSSQLVWVFLAAMAAWTIGVVLPLTAAL